MKQLITILVSLLALFFLNGCGSSNTSVNTGFTSAMVEDQPFYTFDESQNRWIRVIFDSNGQMIYEILTGSEVSGTYTIEDGKIVVHDDEKNPVIALDSVQDTLWEVTGTDNDGTLWQDTWHLELKFRSDMLVGKRFLSEFTDDGVTIKEELLFTETTYKIYNMDGALREEIPYTLENGAIKSTNENTTSTLFLMFIEPDDRMNTWYLAEEESGHSTWSPEVEVDMKDNGGEVTLKSGNVLVLSLDSNPSTGYRWEVRDINTSILEQIGTSEYRASEVKDPPVVGAGGTEIFHFRAITEGTNSLQLIYKQPWETEAEDHYELNVLVH